jgi:YidC/Oxa1 family membrane protein insertase
VGAVIDPNSGLAWVLTIAILVILMRLVLLPLFIKQMHATRKMSAIAPQMQELRKRYKNDRQTLNEETMKLYREHGVNPLGGCLPLVAQLPLFFALFGVLRGISVYRSGPAPYHLTTAVIHSAQRARIFGASISDKVLFTGTLHVPLHAKIVILVAVIISVVTTYLTVRQSTKRGMTPQMTPDNPMAASQKYMTYIVPLFALSGLYWQFGLVLYWMMTNLWTLGQQYVLFKRFPSLTAPVPPSGSTGTGPAAGSAKQAPASPRQGSGPKQVAGGNRQASAAPGGGQGSAGGKPPSGSPASPPPGGKPAAGPAASGKPSGPARKQAAPPAAGNRASGGQSKPAERRPAGAGQPASSNGSGLLRRLGRGRAEPEPQPETPEVKLVRQQRVRQPRSKRTGKR